MPQNRCSGCLAHNLECTYVGTVNVSAQSFIPVVAKCNFGRNEAWAIRKGMLSRISADAASRRFVANDRQILCRYVENLENRLESMEKLLKVVRTILDVVRTISDTLLSNTSTQLCPDADFTQDLGAQIDSDDWQNGRDKRMFQNDSNAAGVPKNTFQSAARLATTAWPTGGPSHVDQGDLSASDDELGNATITEGIRRLAVEPLDRRFFGKSSGVMLVQAAMNLKRASFGIDSSKDLLPIPSRRPEFWCPHPVRIHNSFGACRGLNYLLSKSRSMPRFRSGKSSKKSTKYFIVIRLMICFPSSSTIISRT